MDVSVKVSLVGGHHWTFTCDRDAPIVFGLVAALPGATVDAALPPDGLIQIESQTGERMYVTRASLVAVTVQEIPEIGSHPPATFGGASNAGIRNGTMRPSEFTLVPACFGRTATADLQAVLGRTVASGQANPVVDLRSLPDSAAADLVTALVEARASFAVPPDLDTHLDIRIHRVTERTFPPTTPVRDDLAVLEFFVALPCSSGAEPSFETEVDDVVAGSGRGVAAQPGRRVGVPQNTVLVLRAGQKHGPLHFEPAVPPLETFLLAGQLRRGSSGEPG